MKICQKCSNEFPSWIRIDDKLRNLKTRKFCLECSPFGSNNRRDLSKVNIDLSKSNTWCNGCKKHLTDLDFFLKEGKRYSRYCKSCASVHVIKQQRKNKLAMIEYKGGCCQKCGYDKCIAALEFHHIDPSNKDMSSTKFSALSLERAKSELDKCILLCANCHRETHNPPDGA